MESVVPPFQRGVLREQRGAVGVERFQAPVPGQYRFELRQRPARRAVGGHGQAQRRAQGRDEGVLARRAGLPQQLQPKVAQGRIQRRVAAGRNLRGRPAGLERRDARRAGAQQQGHRQCKRQQRSFHWLPSQSDLLFRRSLG